MQDFDAMLLFSYKTADWQDSMQEFGYQVDPTVWDLFAAGALVFLRGDVSAPEQLALLEFGPDRLFRADLGQTDLTRLAYWRRIACSAPNAPTPMGDLTVWPVHADKVDADELLKQSLTDNGQPALQNGVYTNQTDQIRRDVANGRMSVATPRFCSLSGELDASAQQVGALTLQTATPVGSIVAISLDNQPLSQSHHYMVKMVSVAENTGQSLLPAATGAPSTFVVEQVGKGPVLTFGAPSPTPTLVGINRKPFLAVSMVNGTWEAVVDGPTARFWCDTPNVNVTLFGQTFQTRTEPVTVRLGDAMKTGPSQGMWSDSDSVLPTPVKLPPSP